MEYILIAVQLIILVVQLFTIKRQGKQKKQLDAIFCEVMYSQKNQFVSYLRLIEICNIEFNRMIKDLSEAIDIAIKEEKYENITNIQKAIKNYQERLNRLEEDRNVILKELEDIDK